MSNLILHTGASITTREDVMNVATPPRQGSHYPISHGGMVDSAVSLLQRGGYQITKESHALTKDGDRYFGVFDLAIDGVDDWGLTLGVRNTHDKSFSSGIVLGTRVFVCDNLAFSGEIKLARKHTRYINRDMPGLMARALGRLGDHRDKSEHRIAAYQGMDLSDVSAHDMIIQAVDVKAIPCQSIPHVLQEWRKPSFPDFEARNAWSLFNAFTEVYKQSSVDITRTRAQALHGLFDASVGLAV